jgi:hypothetical protein
VSQGRVIHLEEARWRTFENSSGPPPLLFACWESRGVAKKLYTLGFDRKMANRVPMYFSPADTLYFDDLRTLQRFLTRDARCSTPQPLNNCSILSVAIGSFSTVKPDSKMLVISKPFTTSKGRVDCGGKTRATMHLAKLTNLEELILLIEDLEDISRYSSWDMISHFYRPHAQNHSSQQHQPNPTQNNSESVYVHPAASAEAINRNTLAVFKATFEFSLFQSLGPVIERLSNHHKNRYGLTLPLKTSEWWQNPSITIKQGSTYRYRHRLPKEWSP